MTPEQKQKQRKLLLDLLYRSREAYTVEALRDVVADVIATMLAGGDSE